MIYQASPAALAILLWTVPLWLISSQPAPAQAQSRPPSELIAVIIHREGAHNGKYAFTCGITQSDREAMAAGESLTKLGDPAASAIKETLDSMIRDGNQDDLIASGGLLLFAYATIRGPGAFPLESSMLRNPQLAFFETAVDSSTAISLGLTSYISFYHWTKHPTGPVLICGGGEPRHALDQLVLAWESNDRQLLEEALGPDSKATLSRRLTSQNWEEFRARRWRGPSEGIAVGYRFVNAPVRWSLPALTFADRGDTSKFPFPDTKYPELDTEFTSESGKVCGEYRVRFSRAGSGLPRFLVNDTNIEGILSVISSCAALPQAQ